MTQIKLDVTRYSDLSIQSFFKGSQTQFLGHTIQASWYLIEFTVQLRKVFLVLDFLKPTFVFQNKARTQKATSKIWFNIADFKSYSLTEATVFLLKTW